MNDNKETDMEIKNREGDDVLVVFNCFECAVLGLFGGLGLAVVAVPIILALLGK